jgi:hypothetical protein
MNSQIPHQLVASLFLWSLVWLGLAVLGLSRASSEWWRSFWLMSGLWGLVDGAIAWFVLVRPPIGPVALQPILGINAGLDVVYLIAGAALALGRGPRLRGFGWAVLVQGAFLLAFDLYFYWRCSLP